MNWQHKQLLGMNEVDLLNLLKSEIPLSSHMGISDLRIEQDQLSVNVPLAPNRNHKQTMFGGSIYSVCAISCYALFLSSLRSCDFTTNNIVIADGNIKYLKPIAKNAKIQASWKSIQEKEEFFKKLKTKRKAKTVMQAQVFSDGNLCAEFFGSFVAFL